MPLLDEEYRVIQLQQIYSLDRVTIYLWMKLCPEPFFLLVGDEELVELLPLELQLILAILVEFKCINFNMH